MDALIVIDMQNGCFATPRFDRDRIVRNINTLIDSFRNNNKRIIFVQHNGIKESYLLPGTDEYEIISELHVDPSDIRIEKLANSAFYRTELEKTLHELKINTLFIAGLATEFCVNATVLEGLNRDFPIIVANDAHTTADREFMQAFEIIKFYNQLWSNLTPTGGFIKTFSTEEITKNII